MRWLAGFLSCGNCCRKSSSAVRSFLNCSHTTNQALNDSVSV